MHLRPLVPALGFAVLTLAAQTPAPMPSLGSAWQAQWALRGRLSSGGAFTPSQAWRATTGQVEVPPAFDGTRLVVVNANPKKVQALDPASGKVLWEVPFTGLLDGPPQLAGDAVVFTLEGGRVVVLDAGTGALRNLLRLPAWQPAKGSSAPAKPRLLFPAIANNLLVVGWHSPSSDSRPEQALFAFDLATGALRWSATLPGTSELHPLLLGDRVLAGGGGQLTALDSATGKAVWTWKATKRAAFESCQLIEDRIFLRTAQEIHALDPVTGRMLWSQEAPGSSLLVGSGDRLVFTLPRGAFAPVTWVVAYNARTGEKAWEQEADDARLPWIQSGRVLLNVKEELVALDLLNGGTAWRRDLGGALQLPVQVQGDAVMAVHRAKGGSRISTFRITDGAETGSIQIREKVGTGQMFGSPKGILLPLAEGGVAAFR